MSSQNKAWSPIFTPTFREHLLWWRTRHRSFAAVLELSVAKKDSAKINKILDLVETVCQNPFKGIGKPEPLKYIDSNIWSRRINLEHRLVYRIKDNRIYFLQCRYHYD